MANTLQSLTGSVLGNIRRNPQAAGTVPPGRRARGGRNTNRNTTARNTGARGRGLAAGRVGVNRRQGVMGTAPGLFGGNARLTRNSRQLGIRVRRG